MKIACLINCHKNMKHVARLAHRLHSENTHIFIHVDKKVPQHEYEELHMLTGDLAHCHISKTRINGKLDNRSLVDIVFALVSDAKQIAKANSFQYSYYSNMSGQDYPIKPLEFIEKKLEANYPAIHMEYRDAASASLVGRKFNRNKALIRYRDWVLERKNMVIRKLLQAFGVFMRKILRLFGQTASQRIIRNGWKYYQGSAWWVFPDYVIDAIEKEYHSQTEFSTIMIDESTTPEETYFQSMVMHLFYSDFAIKNIAKPKILDLKTHADFGPLSNRPQTHHPYILTMADYERLCQSECWYARKFDDSVDAQITNKIDETLL